MGNSEVGHLTIGSGRILYQDLVRVNRAVEDGSLFENEALVGAFRRARERGGHVHLLGLVSYGGVHSHIDHLRALLELAEREGMAERTWVHAFTDGRDVSPQRRRAISRRCPPTRIATVVGRYYAMDRDQRWERTDRALAAIVRRRRRAGRRPGRRGARELRAGVTDEFVEPIVLAGRPRLDPARDAAIFFNFRPDRVRQLSRATPRRGVDVVDDDAVPRRLRRARSRSREQVVADTLAETLAGAACRQLHAAETEKYAHVTYFFNGGVEEPWPGEDADPRSLAARRAQLRPQARDVGAPRSRPASPRQLGDGYGFCVVNFANPDMVGHTGVIPAVVRAVETVDACLGEVVDATHRRRWRLPRHGRPRQRRAAARGRRRQPAHRAHDEPGTARRHPRAGDRSATAASSPTSLRPCSICSESRCRQR